MISFERMRVSARLVVAGAVVFVGLALFVAYAVMQIRSDALAAHDTRIKDLVEVARDIVVDHQKLVADQKLSLEDAQLRAKEALRSPRFGKGDYFFLYDYNGLALMVAGSPKIEGQVMLGKTDAAGFKLWDAIVATGKAGSGYLDYVFPRAGQTEPKPKRGYVIGIPEWKWVLGTGVYVDDVDEIVRQTMLGYGLIGLAVLAVVALVAGLISRSIVRQLGGEPAEAIELMSRVAAGDLTVDVRSSNKGSILDSVATMVHGIRAMVTEISASSIHLTQGAEQISTASREVAIASQHQSDATSSMAAAIEEMTVSINHISDSAKDTQQNSLSSVDLSEEGYQRVEAASREIKEIASSVSDASTRIRKLEEGAKQISSIAGVIKDIAGQTNLLALNAAIEAARAGEQGRGFAVVADEVRKLAERTSSATAEIEQMIVGIQNDTSGAVDAMSSALPEVQEGVELASSASASLLSIEEGARRTLERVGEVADATREQSSASTSIAQRVEQIANMVEETTTTIRGTAESAHQLEKIANSLKAMIGRFRV